MYAVAVTILFKDGKLGELKDFFENTGFPAGKLSDWSK